MLLDDKIVFHPIFLSVISNTVCPLLCFYCFREKIKPGYEQSTIQSKHLTSKGLDLFLWLDASVSTEINVAFCGSRWNRFISGDANTFKIMDSAFIFSHVNIGSNVTCSSHDVKSPNLKLVHKCVITENTCTCGWSPFLLTNFLGWKQAVSDELDAVTGSALLYLSLQYHRDLCGWGKNSTHTCYISPQSLGDWSLLWMVMPFVVFH